MSNKGFYHEGVEETKQACRIARTQRLAAKKRRMERFYGIKKNFMFRVLVDCQLYRGEEEFPRTRLMTGAMVGRENRTLRMDFIKRLDKDEDAMLWRWGIIDTVAFNILLRQYINGLVKLEQLPCVQNKKEGI